MYVDIFGQIRERIDELEKEARVIVYEHWDYHLRENVNRAPEDKGRLNVYVRRKHDSVEIYWATYKFIRSTTQEKSWIKSTYLRKGKGYTYSEKVLARVAKEFELDVALATEKQLGAIRYELGAIGKALRYLREAEKRQFRDGARLKDSP